MPRSIPRIEWKRSSEANYTDVTEAIEARTVSATPHPDPEIEQPEGYAVTLTLKPDRTDFADELQTTLLDIEPARGTLHLEGVDAPITDLSISVSKVPYPGEQDVAELGVPPESHNKLHEHF